MPRRNLPTRPRGHRGSALLITLAFIVLATVVILAFFSQTRHTLLITSSVPARVRTDALVQSAVETTISDLRLEMLAGSEIATGGDFTELQPMAVPALRRWTMVPARVISPQVPASGFENLVKQSLSGQPFYPGSTGQGDPSAYADQGPAKATGPRRASAVNTRTESPNGRRLSAKRWSSVALAAADFPDSALPDWIYVTRGGIKDDASALSAAAAADSSLGNPDYVVGRYAYNIYDTGGLLNANAAGAPSSLSKEAPRKGSLAWADLRALGLTQAQVDRLVAFRDAHSQGLSDYGDILRLRGEPTGFLEPRKTDAGYDGFFHTRGDLIRFFLNVFGHDSVAGCSETERKILASFTHDVRFLTAPSWVPDKGRAKIRPAIAGGNDSTGKDDKINPEVATFVVAADNEFTRLRPDENGNPTREVPAMKGEPFVNSRFALSRLGLITRTATAKKDSPIERYFGITRSSTSEPWVYNHGDAHHILTLEEVRARSREPDMVELLKASILAGSLGKRAGVRTTGGSQKYMNEDPVLDLQVLQIFVNLIDQFDADGYPTTVTFPIKTTTGGEVDLGLYGVENLPYLTRIKSFLVRLLPDTTPFAKGQPYSMAFLPEIWNPHDLDPPADRPTRIRVIADSRLPGLDEPFLRPIRIRKNNSDSNPWQKVLDAGFTPDQNHLELDAAALNAREPLLLKSDLPQSPGEMPNLTGLHTERFTVPFDTSADGDTRSLGFQSWTDDTYPGVDFGLEYLDPIDNSWHRYFDRRINRTADATSGNTLANLGKSSPEYYPLQSTRRTVAADPRSDRFGSYIIQEQEIAQNAYADGASLRPDSGAGHGFTWWANTPQIGNIDPGWKLGPASLASAPGAYAIGTILQNTESSPTRYADPDGVLRPGDGALEDGAGMYARGNFPSRPIVLNRPFRSVGEMGYAFRGTPCRSLDFFSARSGDSALLDFFSATEVPDDGVTAGKISANSATAATLAALLRGAIADEADEHSGLSASAADTAAQTLVNLVHSAAKDGGPLLNRQELVTRWLGDTGKMPVTSDSGKIKRQREVFIRALADSVETRTWNLLIDLIAQTGRIPKGKSSLDKFVVESERHVWVHLSIDRLTGRILHLSQEPADD